MIGKVCPATLRGPSDAGSTRLEECLYRKGHNSKGIPDATTRIVLCRRQRCECWCPPSSALPSGTRNAMGPRNATGPGWRAGGGGFGVERKPSDRVGGFWVEKPTTTPSTRVRTTFSGGFYLGCIHGSWAVRYSRSSSSTGDWTELQTWTGTQ